MKKHYILFLLSSAVMLSACGNEDSQRDTVPDATINSTLVTEQSSTETTFSTTTASYLTTEVSSNTDRTEDSSTTTTTVMTTTTADSSVSDTTTTSREPVATTTTAKPVTTPKVTTTTAVTTPQVQFKSLSKTTYTSTLASFYISASDKSKMYCYIPNGTAITVIAVSTDGAWYNVVYNGIKGFVKAGQTTDTKPKSTTAVTSSVKQTTTSKTTSAAFVSYSAYEAADQQTIVKLTNELRNSLGLGQLKVNDKLTKAAAVRAKEIAKYFDHTRPDGSSFFTAIENGAVFYYLGENIAMRGGGYRSLDTLGAANGLFDQWKNSEGHYKNMVTPEFNCIGVAVYYEVDPNKKTYAVYGVQMFGQT